MTNMSYNELLREHIEDMYQEFFDYPNGRPGIAYIRRLRMNRQRNEMTNENIQHYLIDAKFKKLLNYIHIRTVKKNGR